MIRGVPNFLYLLLIISVLGCENSNYSRTKDGLVYRIIKGEGGQEIKPKTFLKLHQSLQMGDSLFYTTFGKMAAFGLYDSSSSPTHDFLDILELMKVGDSAIVVRSVDTLAKRGFLQYNEVFKKGTTLLVKIKILKTFSSEEEMFAERESDLGILKKLDLESLKNWVENQGYSDLKFLPEGVIIKTEKEGAGENIDSAMTVSVNYTGRLLDGTVFDSNVVSTNGQNEPFKFIVGFQQVIQGWDLAVRNMKVGEKAKVFIPSMLAYGMQGSPPKIPPYSHLIFDIEILNAQSESQ